MTSDKPQMNLQWIYTSQHLQQCTHFSVYTVVRAIHPVNGILRFSATWGSETREPIKLKFGMVISSTRPHMPKLIHAALGV